MASHAYRKDGTRYDAGQSHHRTKNGIAYASEAWKHEQEPRQFRGVDGEGGNVPEPGTLFGNRHQYLSLRAGPNLLETGAPLSWDECLQFLSGLDRDFVYVSYFFDYDVTMIVRTMPEERVRRLMNRGARERGDSPWPLPVDVGDYQIDYLPHKEFKVRRRDQTRWLIISDVGHFFQNTFLNSLEKWKIGTAEEQAMIAKGKSMRADFTESTEEIKAYNALECVLLEQLMTDFRAVCQETGYVPRKWQGPGHLASAMLARHGVPRRDDIPILKNEQFRLLAQAAYYGGRFETTAAGPITRTVYQYDINGAYVALLRTLPCLIHGTWRQIFNRPDRDRLWFGKVHFNHRTHGYLYNLPVRDKRGNIHYPGEAIGVYWSKELEAAEAAGSVIEFLEGWEYVPGRDCSCKPFDFVDDYYAERLRLGKSTRGYVLKLAGNSIYGKLAQSIGYAPYANPVWAGLITSGCRAMLIDAYRQAPDSCYMLATDGLFMGTKLDLPLSKNLGEWEETIHPNGIFIVQPGLYFMGAEAKSRGVERGLINQQREVFEEAFRNFINSNGLDYTVPVEVTNFITAKQALARNKWSLAGTWEKTTRDISYWWSNKRASGVVDLEDGRAVLSGAVPHDTEIPPVSEAFPVPVAIVRTRALRGRADLESVPYGRMIGGGLRERDGIDRSPAEQSAEQDWEQPDWVQPLFVTESL